MTTAIKSASRPDYAARLALFLLDRTGSIFGAVKIDGMKKEEQVHLFGRYLGRGRIEIDGEQEFVGMTTSLCFGMDRDYKAGTCFHWRQL